MNLNLLVGSGLSTGRTWTSGLNLKPHFPEAQIMAAQTIYFQKYIKNNKKEISGGRMAELEPQIVAAQTRYMVRKFE